MEIERRESGDRRRGQGAEKQLGCQIKWECNGERLVLPLCSDGGEPSVECMKFSYEHQCTA